MVRSPAAMPMLELPLCALQTAELLTLATMRLWMMAHRDPDAGYPDWSSGLRSSGLSEAAIAVFDAMMSVAVAVPPPFALRYPQNCHVSEDEVGVMKLLALMQRERFPEAAILLAARVPPAASRIMLKAAQDVAQALLRASLILPLREPACPPLQARIHTAAANPGLVLVH